MSFPTLPCPTVLRLLLRYEPETGKLFWRPRPAAFFTHPRHKASWDAQHAGKEAMTFTGPRGYKEGGVAGIAACKAHHVAFLIHHGRRPIGLVDHKNGDKTDNRACNLRDASAQQNAWNIRTNRKARGSSKPSVYVGVSWKASHGKWQSHITMQTGKRKHLGNFDSEIEAAEAYDRVARSERGEFARLNFPETSPVPEEGKWVSIGDLAARLKGEIDRAIALRDEVAATEAHAELVNLEHRERVAATVRRCCE